jgi:hypothetical protein
MENELRQMFEKKGAEMSVSPTLPHELRNRVGRQRMIMGGLVAAAAAAVVVAVMSIAGSPAEKGPFIPPANGEDSTSEPTPNETADNAKASGRRIELLDGEVTFRTTELWEEDNEWRSISEAPMGPESLLRHDNASFASVLVVTDPAPLQESCSRSGAAAVSAEVLAGAIRAHPGLSSTEPVVEQIAGVDALRLDVAPVEGAPTCHGDAFLYEPPPIGAPDMGVPLITGTHKTYWGQPLVWVAEEGKRMRLYLLDLPGSTARTVAIVIVAAEEDFEAAVEAASPILDSFEFHEANQ